MDEQLQSDVLDRLARDAFVKEHVANLVRAALAGEIEACLGGRMPSRPTAAEPRRAEAARVFVESITVEGFRGIGPRATLPLRAGPGLTLIVAGNGSGKSSFFEALELLLTGDSQRWSSKRAKVWKEGWRNLHHRQFTRIDAEFSVAGRSGACTVTRAWNSGETLEEGEATVVRDGQSAPLSSLGWAAPLAACRPFLSYTELGSMLEEGPSRLFDALAGILGLEDVVAAADALRDTRLLRARAHKAVRDKLDTIRGTLSTHPDARAAQCLEALSGSSWDLDFVAVLLSRDNAPQEDSEIRKLRELTSLRGPDSVSVIAAVRALSAAAAASENVTRTGAGRARVQAEILEKSLELHQHDGNADCPVCGRASAINDEWREKAVDEVRKLRAESEAADRAHQNLLHAERAARQWITAPPVCVTDPGLLALWNDWKVGASKSGRELAAHLESLAPALERAILETRNAAQVELQKREGLWSPVAQALAEWLPGARKMSSELDAVDSLKSAEDWLRTIATRIHNERFDPIKERVKRIWDLLRTQSHVELEDVTFQGRSTARRVNLEASVDGRRGAALGVMSQGELHSLALSLFLPRATLERSPFRFVLIDDPVQSMDAARVDGLARVLELVAKKRQVVIFTHDARLTEAIQRLQIDATTMEILRHDGSVVEVRREFEGR